MEIEVWHVLPENDSEKHKKSLDCKCNPLAESKEKGTLVVTHNSFDGREVVEWAYEIINGNSSEGYQDILVLLCDVIRDAFPDIQGLKAYKSLDGHFGVVFDDERYSIQEVDRKMMEWAIKNKDR